MIPRTITKEVFCHVFSSDGITPISYATLYTHYVEPYLNELQISEQQYRDYVRGLPYTVGWKLIEIHQITTEEIQEAIQAAQSNRRVRRRAERARTAARTPTLFT